MTNMIAAVSASGELCYSEALHLKRRGGGELNDLNTPKSEEVERSRGLYYGTRKKKGRSEKNQ
jgi:hypothetical protein